MARRLIGLLTAVTCLGFILSATSAAADVGCPGDWIECYESTNPCIIDVYGCDLDRDGDCDTYSPDYRAPGSNCTTEGGADGKCDGTGECTEVPMADHTTCEGANVVYEPDSGLCLTFLSAGSLSYDVAENYCADAYDDGYVDWRLPTIDELRALINTDPSTGGCEDDPINGSCQVSDPDCLDSTTCMDGCDSCDWLQTGYVVPGIPDLGSQFWSSSADTSAPGMQWTVNFREAKVATYDTSDYWGLKTRCVRVPVTACPDADGDGVCDADDICPGFDDNEDANGNGIPDGCDTPAGGPTQEVISDSTAGDSWNHHIFNVEPGSQFSVNIETHSGKAFYFVEWDQSGGFGGNQCYKYVNAGQTDACDNLTVDASATEAYVSVNGLQYGVDYTITVDYVAPGGGAGCSDEDGDGVCDADDICPGFDDSIDSDFDGTPDACDGCPSDGDKLNPGVCGCGAEDYDSDFDGVMDCDDICPGGDDLFDADFDGTPDDCDVCPLDNPNDPDGNGICGDQEPPATGGCSGPNVAEDAANGRCWMYNNAPSALNIADATSYCENLVLDGYDDWRLPTIDELRMIIVDCPTQEFGGSCGVTDPGCLDGTCDDFGCSSCSSGDYLASFLGGSIQTTISSSDDGSGLNWAVRYANGYMFRRGSGSTNKVRCVRLP